MNLDARITYLGLRTFNFCYDIGIFILNGIKQGLSDFSAYIGGRYNEWHFLEGEIGPLPDSVVNNRSISNIEWTYNTNNYTLIHSHNHGLTTISSHPWLTGSFRIGNIEYDADEFITRFKWVSRANILPSRKVILNVWSIHSGIWFSERDNPILRVITFDGDQVDIPIFGRNNNWARLLLGGTTDSESDSDSASESGEETESDSNVESDTDESDSNVESDTDESDSNVESDFKPNNMDRENLPASPQNAERNRTESDNVELIDASEFRT